MSEDDGAQGGEGGQHDMSQEQTTSIPLAMFQGQSVKEGDVFEFKVVSVDSENNAAIVAYNTGDEDKTPSGSDQMAEDMDKPAAPQMGKYEGAKY